MLFADLKKQVPAHSVKGHFPVVVLSNEVSANINIRTVIQFKKQKAGTQTPAVRNGGVPFPDCLFYVPAFLSPGPPAI